jgi:MYXO-CTERM domain-containing protein
MPSNARPPRRRLFAGLLPVVLALGALPLLAPTCGGGEEGYKTFARSSLIIPMDVCYQYQTDGMRSSYAAAPGCAQPVDQGDVIKAYGLVYQLIRNGVAVYWVIDPAKTTLTGYDLSVQYDGGFPVLHYDWASGAQGSAPTQDHLVRYMGGPFVVDGSDFAKASAILQRYKSTFSNVNVHVSNVAFRGFVKKTMAGGWSAGGAVAPKVALLDIGSTSNPASSTQGYAKNSEPIIRGYLARAGLDFAGAGGTALGPHGEIYDRLTIEDFQPAPGSTDPSTSRLFRNGYQILWVPHWFAPGSCANASSQSNCYSTLYSRTDPGITDRTLATIGAFVAQGKDIFAECAGLGSFEGVPASFSAYQDGETTTHFHATTGMSINKAVAAASYQGSFSSPLMQLGDYPFIPRDGAIQNYKPTAAYQAGVVRLVADATDPTWDYFTLLPGVTGSRGTVVYLGGHVYSGYRDSLSSTGQLQLDTPTFEIGGTRLVLNTLFNLGAGCTESGVTCNTGQLGVCAEGVLSCSAEGQPVCLQKTTAGAEQCNGLDDDCDGLVDEGLEQGCYGGPANTAGVGLCREGVVSCMRAPDGTYGMSACTGQVLPAAEVCNALDDDCDGAVDEAEGGGLMSQACYFGPQYSLDPSGQPRGECRGGTQTCSDGNWSGCVGQVLPVAEDACADGGTGNLKDDDCDGSVDQNCGCTEGATRLCYTGAAGTANVGPCRKGTQTCSNDVWSACAGEILPAVEICGDGIDNDCDNSLLDDAPPICAQCAASDTQSCYTGPASSLDPVTQTPRGVCDVGARACVNGDWGSACQGEVLPANADACDALDNDCDGAVDEDGCGSGFKCEQGVCVAAICGTEMPCPEGYTCSGGTCVLGSCNGVTCAPGKKCQYGACVDPCEGVVCGEGNVCASGACTAGACYFAGCGVEGELCLDSACAPDPCADVLCPSGTFCRQGDCVQACTFVSCREGERCGEDGFCVTDGCAGKTCAAGERCTDGACRVDPCAGKSCGKGQICSEGLCVDDPCTGVRCPAGACVNGQCYPIGNPTGAGTIAEDVVEATGCGCGSSGGATALFALLGLAALPLARRRRPALAPARARAASRLRGPLVLLLAVASLVATGCKKADPSFDPSACAETCDEQRCVDVAEDAVHCGACGASCAAGEHCVDGACGPSSAVAPFVRGVSPGSAPKGGLEPVIVEVTGERFASGATLRTVSPAGSRAVETEFVDAGHLRAELDLTDASATTWSLRVVNPDRVISNAVAFDVFLPTPVITALTPPQLLAGATADVIVSGSGFSGSSRCHLSGAQLVDTALASQLEGAGLRCTVNGAEVPPGAYQLWVVNDSGAAFKSNSVPFAIVSDQPIVSALSPSSGGANDGIVEVTVTGGGFDPTSVVLFDGLTQPTTYLDASRLLVALSLAGKSAGLHAVEVRNGTGLTSSSGVRFDVGASQAVISNLSPGSAWQGDVLTVTFTGSGFPAGTRIEAAPPSGAFALIPVAAVTCAGVCGTLELAGKPAGTWLLRLAYPDGGGASGAWSFRVLSNQAILRDASPRGGAQGATIPVTLTAANLRLPLSEVRVLFSGIATPLVPTGTTDTTVTVSLPLAAIDTGTHALSIVNPYGALPSNEISFNVTPGMPTLVSLTPAFAVQSDDPAVNPAVVTLTGTNFATPDAGGNGGSIVHIAAPELGLADYAIPAADTTVVSQTELKIRLDARTGLKGVYDVTVWNPSAPTSNPPAPQKSNTLADAFRIQ